MPYNTRRKSLSLAELGILPKRCRGPSHPSPPSTVNGEEPPIKKTKTSHGPSSSSPPPNNVGAMSPPRTTSIRIKEEKPSRPPPVAQLSPPPSPPRESDSKIDTEGINDDIVVGTIEQLQRTGNRPHLVKELAAVLATNVHAVDKSANPAALISSRLATYLNRSRPAFSPCPIAKIIEPVHPRRLYFYLTTMPRQALPDPSDTILPPPRITPSLSSTGDEEEEEEEEDERYTRARTALSPSPEVDLSSPELEDENNSEPASPSGTFSGRNSIPRDHQPSSKDLAHNRRAASPQLEPEERTFKQTANQLYEQAQQRQNSIIIDVSVDSKDAVAGAMPIDEAIAMSVEQEETEESVALKNRQAAAELFFQQAEHLKMPSSAMDFSSPMMLPQTGLHLDITNSHMKLDQPHELMEQMTIDVGPKNELPDPFAWDSLQSPETIELAELDDMFDAY